MQNGIFSLMIGMLANDRVEVWTFKFTAPVLIAVVVPHCSILLVVEFLTKALTNERSCCGSSDNSVAGDFQYSTFSVSTVKSDSSLSIGLMFQVTYFVKMLLYLDGISSPESSLLIT